MSFYLPFYQPQKANALLIKAGLIYLAFVGGQTLAKSLDLVGPPSSWSAITSQFILSLFLSAVAWRCLPSDRIFSQTPSWSKTVKLLTLLLCSYFLIFVLRSFGLLMEDGSIILKAFLMATSAAIFEELLVRGLFFAAFLSFFRQSKYSLVWTGLAQALVFGLAHFYNLNQQGLVEISQQVFYASVFALIFAVIRIRFNQLWLVIVLHFFVDFQPRIVADQALKPAAWPQILISFTPMALIALWTLMKMDRDRRQGSSTLD